MTTVTERASRTFECSAGRIEAEAGLTLFKGALEKNGLRYATILSDGGSCTFHALTQEAI